MYRTPTRPCRTVLPVHTNTCQPLIEMDTKLLYPAPNFRADPIRVILTGLVYGLSQNSVGDWAFLRDLSDQRHDTQLICIEVYSNSVFLMPFNLHASTQ